VKAQRLRFRYRVTSAAGDLSNRDLVRVWETAVAAAGYALSYSEGRRRLAQVALAAPLPLGVTSGGEIADIYLEQPGDPAQALKSVAAHLPPGIEALHVSEMGIDGPSLQSQLRRAEYEVAVPPGLANPEEIKRRIDGLLAADTLPSEYARATKLKSYDLRPLILGLEVATTPEATIIRMRLRAEQDRTARADQVLLALGIDASAARIHRVRLEVDKVSAALQAHRRAGEPTGSHLD